MTEALFAIVGPTATGKSLLALEVAERLEAEIVTVDSAQIFRGLDIGTAKPTAEEQQRISHHLIDVVQPDEQWTAAQFTQSADEAIANIRSRGRVPMLVGGTGLWMRALVHGIFEAPDIDPEIRHRVRTALAERGSAVLHRELAEIDPVAAARIQPNDPQRIGRALEVYRQTGVPISTFQAQHGFREARYHLVGIALDVPRDELWIRVAMRARRMYAGGLLDEARAALERGISRNSPGLRTIGYRDAVRVVTGEMSQEEAEERTIIDTRRYAKRQRNWFNHEPAVRWVAPDTSARQAHESFLLRAKDLQNTPGKES